MTRTHARLLTMTSLALALSFGTAPAHAGFCGGGVPSKVLENGWWSEDFFLWIDPNRTNGTPMDHPDTYFNGMENGPIRIQRSSMSSDAFADLKRMIYLALVQDREIDLWSNHGSCSDVNSITMHNVDATE